MARSKTFHFPSFSVVSGNVKAGVSMERFEKQFEQAQYWLDGQVFNSMVPFMPFRDGNMMNVAKIQSASLQGSGKVIAAAPPYGRFLYEGVVMVDPETMSPFARKGAKKVVTDRPLQFSKIPHPDATDHWFDAAKEKDGKAWVKGVKRIAGGKK